MRKEDLSAFPVPEGMVVGLTKREFAAIYFMAAIITNVTRQEREYPHNDIARYMMESAAANAATMVEVLFPILERWSDDG